MLHSKEEAEECELAGVKQTKLLENLAYVNRRKSLEGPVMTF